MAATKFPECRHEFKKNISDIENKSSKITINSDYLRKLYLRSLKNDGKLMLNDSIFYTPKMLATITRHKEKDVKNDLVQYFLDNCKMPV